MGGHKVKKIKNNKVYAYSQYYAGTFKGEFDTKEEVIKYVKSRNAYDHLEYIFIAENCYALELQDLFPSFDDIIEFIENSFNENYAIDCTMDSFEILTGLNTKSNPLYTNAKDIMKEIRNIFIKKGIDVFPYHLYDNIEKVYLK